MLHTTPAIVLHTFKYGESGIITRVLTPQLGLQSYLVQGARKSKSRIRANAFQPLSLLEMVVYHKEKSGLQRIKEIRSTHPFHTIGIDIRKSSVAIFLCEMLLNAYKQQEPPGEAFEFIFNAILQLDKQEENLASFHITFLLQLSKFLGFFPARNYSSEHCHFNLREGIYQNLPGSDCMEAAESNYFFQLSDPDFNAGIKVSIPVKIRKNMLSKTIEYYRYHIAGFKEIKSHKILESVFL